MTRLLIARFELLEAFKLLRKVCWPKQDEEAVLSFDGSCLHIELGGLTVTPRAEGVWPGQARVRGHFVVSMAKMPPVGSDRVST